MKDSGDSGSTLSLPPSFPVVVFVAGGRKATVKIFCALFQYAGGGLLSRYDVLSRYTEQIFSAGNPSERRDKPQVVHPPPDCRPPTRIIQPR